MPLLRGFYFMGQDNGRTSSNVLTCCMGVAIQRPERRIGSRGAGVGERAPIFACYIPLRWLIKDQRVMLIESYY